jgi:hypothetical protein
MRPIRSFVWPRAFNRHRYSLAVVGLMMADQSLVSVFSVQDGCLEVDLHKGDPFSYELGALQVDG